MRNIETIGVVRLALLDGDNGGAVLVDVRGMRARGTVEQRGVASWRP